MLRRLRHRQYLSGHILGAQRLPALVHLRRALLVPVKAHFRELRLLYGRRRHLTHADAVPEDIKARTPRNRVYGVLRAAVDGAPRVDLVPGRTADVDDVPFAPRHHPRTHQARHVQQPLDIGVDHVVDLAGVHLVDGPEAPCLTGIID